MHRAFRASRAHFAHLAHAPRISRISKSISKSISECSIFVCLFMDCANEFGNRRFLFRNREMPGQAAGCDIGCGTRGLRVVKRRRNSNGLALEATDDRGLPEDVKRSQPQLMLLEKVLVLTGTASYDQLVEVYGTTIEGLGLLRLRPGTPEPNVTSASAIVKRATEQVRAKIARCLFLRHQLNRTRQEFAKLGIDIDALFRDCTRARIRPVAYERAVFRLEKSISHLETAQDLASALDEVAGAADAVEDLHDRLQGVGVDTNRVFQAVTKAIPEGTTISDFVQWQCEKKIAERAEGVRAAVERATSLRQKLNRMMVLAGGAPLESIPE